MTLANPNRKEIGQLGSYLNLQVDLNFNSVSEMTFEYPAYLENGEKTYLYDEIKTRRFIRTESMGYYMITKCDETNDGVKRFLNVTATSAEIELNYRKLNLFNGTYKFYDPLNPANSLMGQLLLCTPNWRAGHVSVDLWNKYRTFDISDGTIYKFLMNDVEEAYECIFEFDTYNRTINAYTPSDIVRATDIYVSYNNLIKKLDIEENSEEIVTCLSCYGDKNLSIATVNPLGSAAIYEFGYFKQWMSDSLKAALQKWEALRAQYKTPYQDRLMTLKTQNTKLIELQGDLTDLQGDLAAQKEVQAAKIQQGITKDSAYKQVVAKIKELEKKIATKEAEIAAKQAEIDASKAYLKSINTTLSFDNRSIFSAADVLELENYKYEGTYQDSSFIQTSEMSLVEIQDMAQNLYNQSVSLLNRVAFPTYQIKADSTNFVFLPEFSYIVDALEQGSAEKAKQLLGASFHLEIADEEYTEPVLLNVHLNFSDPNDFSITFANRYRLNDSSWQYNDLYGDASGMTSSLNFDYSSLKDWESQSNDLIAFANSSLDLSRNELVNNSKNVDITFGETGLIGRKRNLSTGQYYNEQIWLTYNTLAFTDDAFQSVKTAIGSVPLPNGGTAYGVNAEILIGKIILGSGMTIANASNTMTLDQKGFYLTTNNQSGRIILSPSEGIKVQGNANKSGFKDKFYVDSNGSVTMEGKIIATEGSIAGLTIKADGLYFPNGDFIKKDGTGKLSLFSWSPTKAEFKGNIYAKNLQGFITGDKIDSGAISSKHIRAGSITADHIRAKSITADKLESNIINSLLGSMEALNVKELSVGERINIGEKMNFQGSNIVKKDITIDGTRYKILCVK